MRTFEAESKTEALTIGAGAVVAFVCLWQMTVSLRFVDQLFLPSPLQIAYSAIDVFHTPEFWNDLEVSGIEFVVGYAAAILIGAPLGLIMGWSDRLNFLLGPHVDALNSVPRVTLMPLVIIWFGIGVNSKIVIVFLGAVIPIIINARAGVRTTEEKFIRLARSFGATQTKLFMTIILPGTLPFIFTGLKFAAGRALLGVVVGELYAAVAGIGYFISITANSFQIPQMFVGILVISATGMIVVSALEMLEQRFQRWRP